MVGSDSKIKSIEMKRISASLDIALKILHGYHKKRRLWFGGVKQAVNLLPCDHLQVDSVAEFMRLRALHYWFEHHAHLPIFFITAEE
jgi:hypothetical protein